MRKILTIGMIFLMVLTMVGCKKAEPEKAPEPEVAVEEPEKVVEVKGQTFKQIELSRDGEEMEVDGKYELVFAEDGTFTQRNGDFELSGEYTEDDSSVTLNYKSEFGDFTDKMTKDGNNLIQESTEAEVDDSGNIKDVQMKSVFELVQ